MIVDVWGKTDIGLKRENNQDTILVDKSLGLFVVADGMGGHKGGEVASAMAVETIREVVDDQLRHDSERLNPKELLKHAYQESSARIYHKSTHDNPELMGMGTTMVAGLLFKGNLYVGNVGDSRAYLLQQGQMWQMTEDHSLMYEQIKAGVIREEEAPFLVARNVITRSVGFERDVQVDVVERQIQSGDMFLLCSDGLCGLVTNQRISEIAFTNPPEKVVPLCIKEAKKAGGDDNISVLLLRAREDGGAESSD